jgi:hypothetical protein
MPKIVDVFPFNGEPIITLRLKYLSNYVDEFVIVEARQTHAGVPKDRLYIDEFADIFAPYKHQIRFMVIDEFPDMDDAWRSKHAEMYMKEGTHDSWFRERWQRNFPVSYLLSTYGDDDIVLACDVDEIPAVDILGALRTNKEIVLDDPVYFEMKFFYYNFAWIKPMPWYHAFCINICGLRQYVDLNVLRTGRVKDRWFPCSGWHCSYFLSRAGIRRKLASFAHRECDRDEHKTDEHLRACLERGLDISGRGPGEDCRPYELNMADMWPHSVEFQEELLKMQAT